MHRLATVHARDNQPTNDQRRHDTAYLNKRLFYWSKVRRLKTYVERVACTMAALFPVTWHTVSQKSLPLDGWQ